MIYEEITLDKYSSTVIKRTDENGLILWIPCDPANSDYQAYLNRDNPAQYPIQIPTDGAAQ